MQFLSRDGADVCHNHIEGAIGKGIGGPAEHRGPRQSLLREYYGIMIDVASGKHGCAEQPRGHQQNAGAYAHVEHAGALLHGSLQR